MASRAESVQIGPFIGGLNTYSDDSSIADNEVVECLNFELDLDGSLKSRPPFSDTGIPFPLSDTGNVSLLGYFTSSLGVKYLIGSDGKSSTYYYTGAAWTLITATFAASAMTQFDGKAWLLAPVGEADPGGYWEPSGGFVTQPNMPKGDVIDSYKSRLWVAPGKEATANGTTIYFSELLVDAPNYWKAIPNFISIGSGDGQNIVQIKVYFNTIIIFRTDSVYSLSYNTDPTGAQVTLLLSGIGLSDKDSLATYENFIYFMYADRAYEFYNNRATQINIKVPFEAISTSGFYKSQSVSVFNDRIIFSYYDTMYVFGLKTRTWTRWRSTVHGPIGRFITLATNEDNVQAITHSTQTVAPGSSREATLYRIVDAVTTDSEEMVCSVQTKNYDYEAPSVYKQLFWWGINTVMRGEVKGIVTPIVFNFSVTWGQLLSHTWGTLSTWGQPTSAIPSVTTVIDLAGSGSMRKFIKFPKALRFRQINYRLEFKTDGSVDTAPVRLFSIMTRVRAKQLVSKTTT